MAGSAVPGMALLLDVGGRIVMVIRDELGIAEAAPEGRSLLELVDTASADKARNMLAEILKTGASFRWELNIPLGDAVETLEFAGAKSADTILLLAARNYPELYLFYEHLASDPDAGRLMEHLDMSGADSSGRQGPAGFSMYDEISRLNNELVNTQRELAKKNVQLESLNRRMNLFLGMCAHDLRNPLGVIQTFAGQLLDDLGGGLDSQHATMLHSIAQSSSFMLRLVEDLLDVSVIESGRLELSLSPVRPAELLRKTVALNQVLADAKQIAIEFDVRDEPPATMADPTKLEQVMNNLLGNAVKFSPRDSTVKVVLDHEDGDLFIAICDQGPGIDPEEAETLFTPFARGAAKATGRESSAGLGLAIARRIVDAHNGSIEVESTPGHGACFYISFPLAAPETPPDDDAPGVPPPAPTRPKRVLLAEDDKLNSFLMRRFLIRLGHDMELAQDGREALEMAARGGFDLVLMDVHMPGMDGLEATRQIRALERERGGARVPVIGLSANTRPQDRARCFEAGMDDYLLKPISLEQLAAVVGNAANDALAM